MKLLYLLFLNIPCIFSSLHFWSWVLSPWQASSFLFSHISGYIYIKVQYKSPLFYGSFFWFLHLGGISFFYTPVEPWALPGHSSCSLLVFCYEYKVFYFIFFFTRLRQKTCLIHLCDLHCTLDIRDALKCHESMWKGFLFTSRWKLLPRIMRVSLLAGWLTGLMADGATSIGWSWRVAVGVILGCTLNPHWWRSHRTHSWVAEKEWEA